jgi:hypothetical protein
MTSVDGVTIGSQEHGIEFGPPSRSGSSDPYAGDAFTVRLRAEGLSASRVVFMFRHDWESLATFFADLAAAWRGWEGLRVYNSVENDLEIRVSSDALGRNLFSFVLRDGPTWTWSASLESVELAAGEDTAELSRRISAWAQVQS